MACHCEEAAAVRTSSCPSLREHHARHRGSWPRLLMGTLPVTIDAAFGNGRLPGFRGGALACACMRAPCQEQAPPGRAGPPTPSVGRAHWQKLKLERQGVSLGLCAECLRPPLPMAVHY
jgi:hypothetical protein